MFAEFIDHSECGDAHNTPLCRRPTWEEFCTALRNREEWALEEAHLLWLCSCTDYPNPTPCDWVLQPSEDW